jgi:hypothetical protein
MAEHYAERREVGIGTLAKLYFIFILIHQQLFYRRVCDGPNTVCITLEE